ncbi:hypothetical protein NONI108955_38415 [Nocardia ninae]
MQKQWRPVHSVDPLGTGGAHDLRGAPRHELTVGEGLRFALPACDVDFGGCAVLVGGEQRRGDPVAGFDVVVGDDQEVQQVVDAAGEQIQEFVADQAARAPVPGAGRAAAVVVDPANSAVGQAHREGLDGGGEADVLDAAVAGEFDAGRGVGAFGVAGVFVEGADDPVEEMVGVAAAHPVVGVGQAAVEPQPWALGRAAGQHHSRGVFGELFAGGVVAPGHPGRHHFVAVLVGVDRGGEGIRDQLDRFAAGADRVRGETERYVAVVGGAFGDQVAGRVDRFVAALEAVAAECAASRGGVGEQIGAVGAAGVAAWLEDRVLLWPEGDAGGVA